MHIRLIPHYIFWHYTQGIRDYVVVSRKLLKAIARIFSLRFMFATFFDPFERLGEHYHGGISTFFETFVVNSLMRMVGVIVRFSVIIIGLLFWILAFIFCVAGVFVWACAPLIPVALLYIAIINVIKLV